MPKSQPTYITVVTGLPRSGTSMAMQMLQAGGVPLCYDEHRPADTDNPHGYYEYEPVKRTRNDTSWVATARGRAVKVVFTLLFELPEDHDYRVIFMRRRLEEVLASQSDMLSRLGSKGSRRSGPELIDVFQRQLTKLDGWLADQPNVRTLDLHYNQVIEDPRSAAGAMNAFLDCRLDEDAMATVVDPSLYRHHRPSSPTSTDPKSP